MNTGVLIPPYDQHSQGCSLLLNAGRDVLHRMEDQATQMRHAAEMQETKLNEMARERDVLLKLRHKAEGASSAQVYPASRSLPCHTHQDLEATLGFQQHQGPTCCKHRTAHHHQFTSV